MPRIDINEIDLTTASYQPAETDIAYVPGFSVNPDAPEDLIFCETVSDFEKYFGTYPRMLTDTAATCTVEGSTATVIVATYNQTFKTGMTFTYDGTYWYYSKREYLSGGLSSIGISVEFSGERTSFAKDDKITVIPAYDLSYVYAKELIRTGIPVVYQVVNTGGDYSADAMRTVLKGDTIYNPDSKDGMMDKGEFSIKYLTSGAYPSFYYTYNPDAVAPDPVYDTKDSFTQKMLST